MGKLVWTAGQFLHMQEVSEFSKILGPTGPDGQILDQHKALMVSPWTGWIFWFVDNFECVGQADYDRK